MYSGKTPMMIDTLLAQEENSALTGIVEPVIAPASAMPEAVDPISIATGAYKIYKEIKLWQNENARMDAIAEINEHISRLYEEIARLSQRIEAVRDELLDLIDEVEYRNLVGEVRGLSKALGDLSGSNNRTYLDAAHLIAQQAYIRLIARLEDNFEGADIGHRYIRYLDLFVLLVACRVTVIAGAPGIEDQTKDQLLTDQTSSMLEYTEHAKKRLFDVILRTYEVCRMRSADQVIPPQEGDFSGQIALAFGYRKKGTNDCTFVAFAHISGVRITPPAERAAKQRVSRRINQEINKVSLVEAAALWEAKYGYIFSEASSE